MESTAAVVTGVKATVVVATRTKDITAAVAMEALIGLGVGRQGESLYPPCLILVSVL